MPPPLLSSYDSNPETQSPAFYRYCNKSLLPPNRHQNYGLPDFFIGAHAAVAGYCLLTRDPTRYRTTFPRLPFIAPP